MAFIFIRCFILYIAVVFAVRMMGKRQIGQLQPSELVITILISELAATPIQDTNQPILSGIVPILTLAAIEIAVSLIALKWFKMRRILYGKPVILVDKGKICQDEMKRTRVSLDDLLEQVRESGVLKIEDIDYAILETNGNMTIIPKAELQPLTPKDMKIKPSDDSGLPDTIIIDGKIIKACMKKKGLSKNWLYETLKEHNAESAREVFLLVIDGNGKTFMVRKDKK